MKTTDLIPLILYELSESDKYGFELTKSIENLSNGRIVIKQATLYTILKKLEKSKFISSYWQDSEIGGKRHYYKLTQNGNLQLSTMPSIDSIVARAVSSEEEVSLDNSEEKEEVDTQVQQASPAPEVKETVLPTDEVFKDANIDNLTETEINSANANLLHESETIKSEQFATNKNVYKFTENASYSAVDLSKNLKPEPKVEQNQPIQPKKIENEDIKFVEYINYKQNPKYQQAKIVAKKMWLRILCSSVYLLAMLAISALVIEHFNYTIIGNIFLILGIIILIFCPTIYAYRFEKFKLKCQEGKLKFDAKKHIIISVCIVLFLILAIIIANIAIGNSSIFKLFNVKNFANIYAPLLISSFIFADLVFSYLFLYKKSKK